MLVAFVSLLFLVSGVLIAQAAEAAEWPARSETWGGGLFATGLLLLGAGLQLLQG